MRTRRAVAFLLDLAVAGMPVLIAGVWEGVQGLGTLYHGAGGSGPPVALWLAIAWALAYAVLRDSRILGRSLGKRWMGLRVVATGRGLPAVLLRNLVTLALAFVPLALVVGSWRQHLAKVGESRHCLAVIWCSHT